MKRTIITCDVIGCGEDAKHEVKCCKGWTISKTNGYEHIRYKKFEQPVAPSDTDLCDEHYKQWCRATCHVLKMDHPIKEQEIKRPAHTRR